MAKQGKNDKERENSRAVIEEKIDVLYLNMECSEIQKGFLPFLELPEPGEKDDDDS